MIARREREWEWVPDGPESDPPVRINGHLEWSEASRTFEITEVVVGRMDGQPGLNSALLSSIPWARLRAGLHEGLIERWEHPLVAAWPDNILPRRLDQAAWLRIAAVLRRLEVLANQNTTSEVAEYFGYSRSTAANWARTIRDQGLDQPLPIEGYSDDGWPIFLIE